MDTKVVMTVVAAAAVLMIGIWIVMLVSGAMNLVTVSAIGNESKNFAANDTAYQPTYQPIINVTAMYNDSAHTCTYTSTLYGSNTSGITIYTNGTGDCPNMTTGTHYYDYNYDKTYSANTTFVGTSSTIFSSIQLLAVGLIVLAASIILAYFGFGRRQA